MTDKPTIVTIKDYNGPTVIREESYILPSDLNVRPFTYEDNKKIQFQYRKENIQALGGKLHYPNPGEAAVVVYTDKEHMTHYFYENNKRVLGPNGYAAEKRCLMGKIVQGTLLNKDGELDKENSHKDAVLVAHLLKQNKQDLEKSPLTSHGIATLKAQGFIIS